MRKLRKTKLAYINFAKHCLKNGRKTNHFHLFGLNNAVNFGIIVKFGNFARQIFEARRNGKYQ